MSRPISLRGETDVGRTAGVRKTGTRHCTKKVVKPYSLVLKELPASSVGPGVVMLGEGRPVLHRRMPHQPELDKRIGIGIFQPGLAEVVKGRYGRLLRIGDQAVDRF